MSTQTHTPPGASTTPDKTASRRLATGLVIGLGVLVVLAAGLALASIFAVVPWFVTTGPQTVDPDAGGVVASSGGPGISVEDALTSTLDQPLLINGFLYVTAEGAVYYTDALAESYPPSINIARSLRVEGITSSELTGLERANGIAWSETPTQLAGMVEDGVLTVSAVLAP